MSKQPTPQDVPPALPQVNPGLPPELQELQRKVLEAQLRRELAQAAEAERKEAQFQNALELEKTVRLDNCQKVKEKKEQQIRRQQACGQARHMNGQLTLVVGHKDHNQNTWFFCQGCQGVWLNLVREDERSKPTFREYSALPPGIVVPSEFIGGPN